MRVVVSRGPDSGNAFDLDDATMIVGSHADCDLRLSDPRVSRRHCELRVAPDGVRVADLGSRNGTRHNGARIEAAVLAIGSHVVVGDTELRFEPIDEPIETLSAESLGDLRTKSASMRSVLGLLAAVAPTDTTVLLEGETGTGKEVLAKTIHAQSKRKNGPFLVVDCGSVAKDLVQSELFGHKKGAFTGADDDRAGIFEAASGGTVLIDEIGELALELQPALLRVLEARTVKRVGDAKPRDVDVRIIAATHRSLSDEVKRGAFRADLFYRLAVVRCTTPPLRDRRDDVRALVDTILRDLGARVAASEADVRTLEAYGWPGNVRELRNVLERAVVVGGGSRLVLPKLGSADERATARVRDVDVKGTLREKRGEFERDYLVALLDACDGNVSEAARRAGVDRNHIHRLMKKHGLRAKKDASA